MSGTHAWTSGKLGNQALTTVSGTANKIIARTKVTRWLG